MCCSPGIVMGQSCPLSSDLHSGPARCLLVFSYAVRMCLHNAFCAGCSDPSCCSLFRGEAQRAYRTGPAYPGLLPCQCCHTLIGRYMRTTGGTACILLEKTWQHVPMTLVWFPGRLASAFTNRTIQTSMPPIAFVRRSIQGDASVGALVRDRALGQSKKALSSFAGDVLVTMSSSPKVTHQPQRSQASSLQ